MKVHFLLISLFLLSDVSCSYIRPREVTQEDKERIVFSTARATVTIAITESHKDNVEKQVALAAGIVNFIDNKVMPVLTNSDAPVTKEIEQQVMNWLPDNYKILLATAFEVLNTYYEFPATSEFLPSDKLALLRAFTGGLRAGAQEVLNLNKALIINDPGVIIQE